MQSVGAKRSTDGSCWRPALALALSSLALSALSLSLSLALSLSLSPWFELTKKKREEEEQGHNKDFFRRTNALTLSSNSKPHSHYNDHRSIFYTRATLGHSPLAP